MDTDIIVALISSSGLIIVAIIGAITNMNLSFNKINKRLTTLESNIESIKLEQTKSKKIMKKIYKNKPIHKFESNKINNIDKRLTKLESGMTSKQ